MIKRLLTLIASLALVAVSVTAQTVDRDMLLTTDGTLYTIDSVAPDANAKAGEDCLRSLVLTTQQGTESTRTVVPYSLSNGVHWRPALAYDSDSKTLFLFWTHSPNAMSSELLFCTISADGKFSDLTTFEARSYRLRYNLAIAVTRKVWTAQSDSKFTQDAGMSAHAVWWEETGNGEQARYALLTVEKGTVTGIETRDLAAFVDSSAPDTLSPDADPEIFRHPSIFEAPTHDSVDVIFGDVVNNHFNRINIHPVAQGRLHVPVGKMSLGYSGPPSFAVAPNADRASLSIHSLWDRDTNNLVLYYYADQTVHYLMNRAGVWSSMKSVAMKGGLSAEGAPDVLRRMMAAE
jgi:hypothetical protein